MRVVLRYILVLTFGWAVWGVAGGATLMAANVIAVDVTGKAALSQKGAQKHAEMPLKTHFILQR